MRARWLKPEFFRDKKIGQLGPIPALVYEALWCVSDDGGTAPCEADRMKGEMFLVWPMIGVTEIEEALTALEGAARIKRYRAGDDIYCRIIHFNKHQKVHNPSKFRHPQLGEPLSRDTAAALPQPSGSPHILDTYTPRHPASQERVAAAVVPVDYLTRCVVALNTALRENPKIGARFNEIATTTQVGRVAWAEDGIPVEIAEQVIRERAALFVPNGKNKQIQSLLYLDAPVRERWAELQTRGVTSAAVVPGARDVADAAWAKAQGY